MRLYLATGIFTCKFICGTALKLAWLALFQVSRLEDSRLARYRAGGGKRATRILKVLTVAFLFSNFLFFLEDLRMADALPLDVIHAIFSHLDACSLVAAMRTCKAWRSAAQDDLLWARLCARDWKITSPRVPPRLAPLPRGESTFIRGEPSATYHDTWVAWWRVHGSNMAAFRQAETDEDGELVARAGACWAVIESFQDSTGISIPLNPPADLKDTDLPIELRAILAFHDGQTVCPRSEGSSGIFGSCSFYDFKCNIMLLSSGRALRQDRGTPEFVFAHCWSTGSQFILNMHDGRVYARTRDGLVPCCPPSAHALICWFEDYCAHMQAGHFGIRDGLINLFSQANKVSQVTRGVEVSVSTRFVPDMYGT